MNYRHSFHAGNFADVLKHAVLARILVHLRGKAAAFRVLDTHAGVGRYDLSGAEAARAGEWRHGIARLRAATLAPEAASLLAPYLDAVASLNPDGALKFYPGSPLIARALLRPQDRLIACEIEPAACAALARALHGDPRTKALRIDGYAALNAYLPPKERRGIVLLDPAFEAEDEFARLADGLIAALRKWASGTFALWYPITDRARPAALARALRGLKAARLLRVELTVAPAGEGLSSAGLFVVNPPWTLADELAILLPVLAQVLGRSGAGRFRLDRPPASA